ncbi:hypothetical protein [Methylophaga sp. OBS3]|uniref:hypothetical protein n=1 Tax=Methylophaga sp. OBS3 TaxID=2991934 RepID=UPI002253E189|nr:hypothetical protein [Methylophaga sp. OBS3]MCX4189646.1 hypothetical protein [Methylophaga sp. OBS3]
MLRWFIISISFLLSACVAVQPSNNDATAQQTRQACAKPPAGDTAVRLDMVQQLMDDGRMHAALAHLDELGGDSLYATYLRAEILRQSERGNEAKPLYQQLTESCLAGQGHHGLGLIAGRNGESSEAKSQLAKAAELLPVNGRIRNDYGYALLINGDFTAARHEFLTAIELSEANQLAETNMVILLLLQGQQQKAVSFANKLNMDEQTFTELKAQANTLAKQIPTGQP